MKRILFLALLGSSVAAKAQSIAAGTVAVGGGLGYNQTSRETVTTGANPYTQTYTRRTFGLNLGVNYFVADNVSVGLSVNHTVYGGSLVNSPAISGGNLMPPARGWQWRVGPTAQYYKMFTEQFGIVGTLGAGYENNFQRGTVLTVVPIPTGNPYYIYANETAKGYYANLTPSIVFFPIPKLGLTASAGSLAYSNLSHGEISGNQTARTTSFGAGFGLDKLQFGGTFYFGR